MLNPIIFMEIIHQKSTNSFILILDGYTARVDYIITDHELDIRHTIVPKAIGGRGIASALVQTAYDYARKQGLRSVATCSYAFKWLEKHPEYRGTPSCDYCSKETCAL